MFAKRLESQMEKQYKGYKVKFNNFFSGYKTGITTQTFIVNNNTVYTE